MVARKEANQSPCAYFGKGGCCRATGLRLANPAGTAMDRPAAGRFETAFNAVDRHWTLDR